MKLKSAKKKEKILWKSALRFLPDDLIPRNKLKEEVPVGPT
jgi:hypothetical protein